MLKQYIFSEKVGNRWRTAWSEKHYRINFFLAWLSLGAIVVSFPFFFTHIELRNGFHLDDIILRTIPPTDVSLITFCIIWSTALLLLYRCFQHPHFMLRVLECFSLLWLTRMLCIALVPLNPPPGLIELKDPLTSLVYGGSHIFITKDLFYSGHTSNMFLMFLLLPKPIDKTLALIATIAVSVLVLVQHIHYSIDVVAAYIITYLVYRVGKKITAIRKLPLVESINHG